MRVESALAMCETRVPRLGQRYGWRWDFSTLDNIIIRLHEATAQTAFPAQKDICSFETSLDFLPPVNCGRDTLPVNTKIQVLALEGLGQLTCCFDILAGVRDE